MNKKIIIRNYQQLTIDCVLLFSFLIINNLLSYFGIIPLSISLCILVLTFFFHHKLVKKEFVVDNYPPLKLYIIMNAFFLLFAHSCWFFGIFIEFIKKCIF